MPRHGADAAAERCEVQPAGVSGGLAAERPRGHEHQTGAAEGETGSWLDSWVKEVATDLGEKCHRSKLQKINPHND